MRIASIVALTLLLSVVTVFARGDDAKKPEVTTNSIGMKLALIPAGEFMMGSPEKEAGRDESEQQHRVRITQPFYLGVYTVTQAEYEKVMGKNPSYFSSKGDGKREVKGKNTSRFPAENVSWNEAQEFCKKLSQKEGKKYRLPTEAQWEYACRAGTTTPFCLGASLASTEANFDGNYPYGDAEKGPYLARTTTVGSYKPNALGLYDMHGNVWQWCSDGYWSRYYTKSPTDDPPGNPGSNRRLIRGGSWMAAGEGCRAAYRGTGSYMNPDDRRNTLGFSVAREK